MSMIALVARKVDDDTGRPAARGDEETEKPLSEYISIIASYIPVEILGPYTMALALITGGSPAPDGGATQHISMGWFLVFLCLTPAFVWLLYAVRCKEKNKKIGSWRDWPWWEAFASCVAFVVWSATMPKSAFLEYDWYRPNVWAIALVLISGILPLVGKIATSREDARRLSTKSPSLGDPATPAAIR